MADANTDDAGCGCCQPPPETTEDVVRELLARRDDLDQRIRRLQMRKELVDAK